MLECGVKMSKIKQALDFDLSRLCGALISHEHQDHARAARAVLDAYIPTYMSRGTAEALGVEDRARLLEPLRTTKLGEFSVKGFPLRHDCREPMGFLISHPDMGTMLFATDTYYLPNRFRGLTQVLIECNYDHDTLERNMVAGIIHPKQYERTLQSHMSYETCLGALEANDLSQVNNIVLIHLSDTNAQAEQFERGIRAATGKSVHTARAGLRLDLGKAPF